MSAVRSSRGGIRALSRARRKRHHRGCRPHLRLGPEFGHQVVHALSVGGRNEAHHGGLTDDRMHFWAGGLDSNTIFIFDVHSDPGKPKLTKTIEDFVAKSGGVVGPHTFYALPGRMLITGLSNKQDNGGRTAMVEYTNEGDYLATYWMPNDGDLQGAKKSGKHADGYGTRVTRHRAGRIVALSLVLP